MQFNNFVWNLYANSEAGKNSIEKFQTLDFEKAKKEYGLEAEYNIEEDERLNENNKALKFWVAEVLREQASKWKIEKFTDAEEKYLSMLDEGLYAAHPELSEEVLLFGTDDEGIECWSQFITDVSIGLYLAQPEFFLPYLFRMKFYLFQQICEAFTIDLPKIPSKQDQTARARYYLLISKALYEFRILHNLTPYEMCAFLYDYAPNFIETRDGKELPEPLKAWIIKGGINDNGDYERVVNGGTSFKSYWQGNIDTRRGDILVLYFLTPHKKIHFVGRAYSDGFYDPYFHYKSTILIGSFVVVPAIEFSVLSSNSILKDNPGVRAHMQGPSGVPLKSKEYNALIEIFQEKGFDISTLPKLLKIDSLPDPTLNNEKDVEKNLIEPLLIRLGYVAADWKTQMHLKVGRVDKTIPDYIIGAKEDKFDPRGKFVFEAKFRISSQKQLDEAFSQGSTYAKLLQAKILVIASCEGIWVSKFKNGRFDPKEAIHKDWDELQNPDHFHEIKMMIGKGEIK